MSSLLFHIDWFITERKPCFAENENGIVLQNNLRHSRKSLQFHGVILNACKIHKPTISIVISKIYWFLS